MRIRTKEHIDMVILHRERILNIFIIYSYTFFFTTISMSQFPNMIKILSDVVTNFFSETFYQKERVKMGVRIPEATHS